MLEFRQDATLELQLRGIRAPLTFSQETTRCLGQKSQPSGNFIAFFYKKKERRIINSWPSL